MSTINAKADDPENILATKYSCPSPEPDSATISPAVSPVN